MKTYARSVATTPTIAEDATQETFLRAWRYLDSFRGEGSFEGWLIRICRNCVRDLEDAERRNSSVTDGVTRLPTSPDHSHDTIALLDTLPVEYREVVVLCGVLDYDYESAATVLDVPIGTVRSRLNRARATLANTLDEADRDIA